MSIQETREASQEGVVRPVLLNECNKFNNKKGLHMGPILFHDHQQIALAGSLINYKVENRDVVLPIKYRAINCPLLENHPQQTL